MKKLAVLLIFLALYTAGTAKAWYVSIHDEVKSYRRLGGVAFSLTNNTDRNIETVFALVYGYKNEEPYRFELVSYPRIPAAKITPGPHEPGEKALYLFKIPAYRLKMEKYGLFLYDVSIVFSKK